MYAKKLNNGANSVCITDKQISDGEKMLARALEMARSNPFNKDEAMAVVTQFFGAGSDSSQIVRCFPPVSNLRTLIVQEDGYGNWYADFIVKVVRFGFPDTMGIPVDHPLQSEEAALAWACQHLRITVFINEVLRWD